jgi:argininosuccinate lyase
MDVTLYMGQNFDFISFPEEYTTGSSIMPHKKNPDVFELIRAKCNKLKSLVCEVDLVTANLPSGYHRDFQVLKENLIPAFGELKQCLYLAEKVLLKVMVRENILDAPLYKYISSVDKLNRMVIRGKPFRDAYREVARQIRNKRFSPESEFDHTHEGSMGNLCLDEIEDKMNQRMDDFGFEKTNKAFGALLEG